ncbi:tyrosine-type recombinase/integrase [Clostridium chromiireducens]|uniref:Phage integrase family protein n=1 Tax=Clostridium chromiireducens TaxID=225345 RepID=A0A1V4I3S7_9CLOT|nr:site-specific integrase [Clostridium chromiireducens]OPJ54638.1 phage integrase family protein [Clostridium chromiireducens]
MESKAYERDFLSKQQNHCDMTFKNIPELYLDDCKIRTRSTTLSNKKDLINHKMLPYFKHINTNEITPNHIRKWQNSLKKENYSDTYLKSIHNQIAAIFNFAIKYYNLNVNPALRAGAKVTMAFKILFGTGIRRGELLTLTFNDINLDNNTININKTYTKWMELIL